MTSQEILARLQNVKKSGKGYSARCPSHDDRQNSLVVNTGTKRTFLDCYAHKCDEADICAALGIVPQDLFFEPYGVNLSPIKSDDAANDFQSKKIISVYDYADENGEILYQNVRYEPKDFRQRKPNGAGGYDYNLYGTRRVPYRLPELFEAAKQGADIFLCEGEKDADNLRGLGLTATNFKNWRSEFNKGLWSQK